MQKTRDNHYVPIWHQKGFAVERESELCRLKRRKISLPGGKDKIILSEKWLTPTQCFYQTDLYTTFFGAAINDEIEHKLFGYIDDNGSDAVRAFLTDDQAEWHKHFQDFFVYLDAQKIRTPKGLDWIRENYPTLGQNSLMQEMQSIRMLHCTLWTEGVRELVSAEDSDVKFIVSDHPVTVYNYACPPDSANCEYPSDPDIALKGSQTIFPLSKNRCLILTNLEYAKDPENADPVEQRKNATKLRQSWVKTIEFINTRKLTADEVTKINYIIKCRAKDTIAAGSATWLYPENEIDCSWADIRDVLLPPSAELHRFGGEIYAKFDDGHVYYQDAFGRTQAQNPYLKKEPNEASLGRNDYCGCGSSKKYKKCCLGVPDDKRTSWTVLSIRERNLAICNAIRGILDLDNGKSWDDIRRELSEDHISRIYGAFGSLWPMDTDIYTLLPKPDGKFRGLYTGTLDIRTIGVNALGMAPYFDEFLIQNPLINPNNVKPEFSPVDSPGSYKYQALKDFSFMLALEPYIGTGLVNLIPDPCWFEQHLHREVLEMANARKASVICQSDEALGYQLMVDDLLNSTYMMPRDVRTRMLLEEFPHITEKQAIEINDSMDVKAEHDPLVLLQKMKVGDGGQFMALSMAPNYEMSLFIAQATGSVILTDSEHRFTELEFAQHRDKGIANYPWNEIYSEVNAVIYDQEAAETLRKSSKRPYVGMRHLFKAANELVESDGQNGPRRSVLSAEAVAANKEVENAENYNECVRKIRFLVPEGGFYDAKVQRLLLKSNCQQYHDSVTAVYYVGF